MTDHAPPSDRADEVSAAVAATEVRGTLGALYRRIRQTKAAGDLSLAESAVLNHLRRGGPMTAAALARLERVSPQSMSTTVASLHDRGLIQRGPDPSDGRRVIVSLTPSGDASVAARRAARDEQFTRALESLTPAERAQLLDVLPVLDRLVQAL